jgi:hypothetical protein
MVRHAVHALPVVDRRSPARNSHDDRHQERRAAFGLGTPRAARNAAGRRETASDEIEDGSRLRATQ